MISIGVLKGTIELDDNFSNAMKLAETRITSAVDGFQKLNKTLTVVGTALTTAISVPLAGLATSAVKTFMSFETAMKTVQAAITPTEEGFKRLEAAAIEWGAKTQFSATQAAEALGELGKAGFTTEQSIAGLPAVLQLATVSGLNLKDAATLTADTLTQFNLSVTDAARANDVLTKAAQISTIDVQQLGESLKFVGPVAGAMGMSMEDATAALAAFGNAGIKADMAGSALRNILTDIMNPTKGMTDVMDKLGISTFKSADGTIKLTEVIDKLKRSGADAGDIMKAFGDRAGPAMAALVNKGSDSLRRLEDQIKNSEGAAKEAANTMMSGLGGSIERMRGSVETAGVALGEILAPAVKLVADGIGMLAESMVSTVIPTFKALPTPVQLFASGLLAVVAAVGPLMLAMRGFNAIMDTIIAKKIGAFFFTIAETVPVLTARIWLLEAAQKANIATTNMWAAAQANGQTALAATIGKVALVAGALYELERSVESAAKEENVFETSTRDMLNPISLGVTLFRAFKLAITDTEEAIKQMKKAFGPKEDFDVQMPKLPEIPSQFAPVGKNDFGGAIERANIQVREALRVHTDYVQVLKTVQTQYDNLLPSVKEQILAAKKLGSEALKDVTDRYRLYPATVDMVVAANTKGEKSFKNLNTEIKKMAEAFAGLGAVDDAKTLDKVIAQIGDVKLIDPAKAQEMVDKLNLAIDTVGRLGFATTKTTAEQVAGWVKSRDSLQTVAKTFDDVEAEVKSFVDSVKKGIDTVDKKTTDFTDSALKLDKQINRLSTSMADTKAARGMSKGFQDLVTDARKASNELEDLEQAARDAGPGFAELYDELITLKKAEIDVTFNDLSKEVKEYQVATGLAFIATGNFAVGMDMLNKATDITGVTVKKTKELVFDFRDSISGIGAAFTDLGETAGGRFGDIAKNLGEMIRLVDEGARSVELLNTAFAKRDEQGRVVQGQFDFSSLTGDADEMAASIGALAQVSIQAGAALSRSTNVVGRGNRAKQGAMTGLGIGMNPVLLGLTGGNSAWIAPLIGAIIGALRNPGFEQEMKRVGKEWGVWLSEGAAKEIDKLAKALGDRGTAELLSFDTIAKEAGGIDTRNIDMFSEKLRDLFTGIERGKITTAEAADIIDKNFEQMANTAIKNGKLINDSLRDIIVLDKTMGTNSEAVANFVKTQMSAALDNVGAFLDIANQATKGLEGLTKAREEAAGKLAALDAEAVGLMGKEGGPGASDQKRLDEIAKQRAELAKAMTDVETQLGKAQNLIAATTISSQESASAMAGAISGAVGMMQLEGATLVEALSAAGPAIQALKTQLEATGFDGGAAFADLEAKIALVNDAVTGPALEGIMSLGDGITNLYNGGLLTTDMFIGMANQIGATRDALIAQGASAEQINSIIAPQLQNIWEIQQKWNTTLDATTQAMLDEAEAQGLVGAQFKDVNERQVDGLTRIGELLEALIKGMGIDLPPAMDVAGDAIVDNANRGTDAINNTSDALAKVPKQFDTVAKKSSDAAKAVLDSGLKMVDSMLNLGKITEQEAAEMRKDLETQYDEAMKAIIKRSGDFPNDFPIDVTWRVPDLDLPDPDTVVVPVEYDLPEGYKPGQTIPTLPGPDGTPGTDDDIQVQNARSTDSVGDGIERSTRGTTDALNETNEALNRVSIQFDQVGNRSRLASILVYESGMKMVDSMVNLGRVTEEEAIEMRRNLETQYNEAVGTIVARSADLPNDYPIDVTWQVSDLVLPDPDAVVVPVEYDPERSTDALNETNDAITRITKNFEDVGKKSRLAAIFVYESGMKMVDSMENLGKITKEEAAEMRKQLETQFDEAVKNVNNRLKDIPTDFPIDVDWNVPNLELPDPDTVVVPVEFEMPDGYTPGQGLPDRYRTPPVSVESPEPPDDSSRQTASGNSAGYATFEGASAAMRSWDDSQQRSIDSRQERGQQTISVDIAGTPIIKYTSENLPDYVRLRAGSVVHVP